MQVATDSHLSRALMIVNNTYYSQTLLPELVLPPGWKSVSPLFPIKLDPGKRDLAVIHVYIPQMAPAGLYTLYYRVRDSVDNRLLAEARFTVEVLPSLVVNVKVIEIPGVAIAGTDYRARFVVFNQGNTRVNLDLEIKCGDGYSYDLVDLQALEGISLEMGEQKAVDVIVHTDEKIRRVFSHRLELIARQAWQAPTEGVVTEKRKQLARAVGLVEIIPLLTGEGTLMHTLPVELAFRGFVNYIADDWVGGGGIDLVAKGPLDEKGIHRIELKINKQFDSVEDPLFNTRDRYSLTYATPWFQILAGDQGYSLSPLLDNYRFGRGGGAHVFLEPFSVGAYYYQDIWSASLDQALAGFADFEVKNPALASGCDYKVALAVLSRLQNNILFGVHQYFYPVNEIGLELDLASETDEYGLFHKALFFEGAGDHGWIDYKAGVIYADPEFSGPYRDLYRVSANVGLYFLDRRLSVKSNFYLMENNLLLNPSAATAQRVRFFQAGAGYLFPYIDTDVNLFWQNVETADRFPTQAYDTVENNFKFSLKQPLAELTLSASAYLSFRMNYLTTLFSFLHQYNTGIEWKPTPIMNYTFSLWYEGTLDPSYDDSHRFGIEATAQFSWEKILLLVGLKNSYVANERQLMWVNFDLASGFTWRFGGNKTFSASVSWVMTDILTGVQPELKNTFAFWVKYTTPFEIPLAPKETVCRVRGRIYDEAKQAPREGVILRIDGMATVTDAGGNYDFYLNRAGKYFLTIERGRLGADMIPNIKTPVVIEISTGEEKVVDIGIIRSSAVRGSVAIYGSAEKRGTLNTNGNEGEKPVRRSGLANILVEIASIDETRRLLTNSDGEFLFEEVRPGAWTFRILVGNIPVYHYYEKTEAAFALIPGESKEILIRVLEEKREIKIVETTTTLELTPSTGELDTTREQTVTTEHVPTPTPTPTPVPTPTPTPVPIPTPTPTPRPTPTPTLKPTPSPIPTSKPTPAPLPP